MPPTAEGWTLEEGIKRFRKYCKGRNLSDRTITTYDSYINNFSDWLVDSELMGYPCSKFTEFQAKDFLDEHFDEEEWSPRTYNNHLDFLLTLFNRIQKLEKEESRRNGGGKKIEYEIDIREIEPKKDRAEKNRYYSPAVAEQVKKATRKDKRLYNYIRWIYYSCMRPKEIRFLQAKHIDLHARQIKVIAPSGKTGERFVPICDELYDLIIESGLSKLPLNHYVFGKGGIPSDEKAPKDTFSGLYRPIKKLIGLDDKYTLYGWKHTRVVNLLMAGFTDAEVMSLTGHHDYESFKTYKRELKIDTSAMQGKTVEF
ncbi:Site-specific recombinase XerD [Parapedobacter luteus]|uniref:Site-specific recombinase XerD n=1 Tax=Parapedobacter luteus TaxID=623280 RepID=A0A1T5CAB8_9SPHI|nr:tyrosine-type recombinase/integrase [Parapedobacter luteus]SKB56398.1 Site-specific recombinase XerD [Parapedobacter luteus]